MSLKGRTETMINYSTATNAQAGFPSENAYRKQFDFSQIGEPANWKRLLIAAKSAYDKGYELESVQLYREGLVQADKELLQQRGELIAFLEKNIWG
jgi:hypothetical protein